MLPLTYLQFKSFEIHTQLEVDIYNTNFEMLYDEGLEKAKEREARLRRVIGERQVLLHDIAKEVNA